jgi:6-phosphogluconolactonase
MIPIIRIFKDLNSLSHKAADLFTGLSTEAIKERGRALIVISGGNSPLQLFKLLADEPFKSQIEWELVHIFWADERCVPPDDPESNYGQARRVFLDQLPILSENVHRVSSHLDPVEASLEYARTLKEFAKPPLEWPHFDLVCLGMGKDGHTASLFPGSEVDGKTPTLAVTARYQDRPANRVTLTPKVINSARTVIFLVSGENKAETLARVLDDEHYKPDLYPAQRIHPTEGTLIWMIDVAAASQLPKKIKNRAGEG